MADLIKTEQSLPPAPLPETSFYPPFEVPREQSEVLRRYLHGLGKRKAKFLPIQYSAEHIEAMKAVKRRFDPEWRFGRGTLFELPSPDS